jgi:hypothetical protein
MGLEKTIDEEETIKKEFVESMNFSKIPLRLSKTNL